MALAIGGFGGYAFSGQQMNEMDHDTMSMDSMMEDMMANLEGKTGDEYDKAFLEEMIVHHEGAVVMTEDLLVKTDRPELVTLGEDILTAQNKEISMMKQWLAEWFN